MGPWLTARREVLRVLGSVIPRLVDLMGAEERENYLVVLLPVLDQGAESYRRSFALTLEVPPSRANSALWGNLIAHEIFHLWNGWRLRGTDYPSSQWFQEGFTEYAANVAVVNTGLIDADEFLQKLSDHVKNYGKLVTTLEGSGSHKGPPLYSAGALVAFSWDVQIRQATDGKRGFSDLLKALWKQTNHGRASYAWPDIEAALTATAPFDWEAYYQSFIRGNEPLPLDGTFASAGLRLVQAEDGTPRVTIDPTASAASKALFRALIDGN
jgi:predicted metalloprotease with PDZ domain